MVRHINTRHHAVSSTWELQSSRPIHCVYTHPIIESQHAGVFIPPVLCAPADRLGGSSQSFELAQKTIELRINGRFERRSSEQLTLFLAPKRGKKLVREELDILCERVQNSDIVGVRAADRCL
jgi:hypothetical protein